MSSTHRRLLVLALAGPWSLTGQPALADVFILADGDRITGTSLSEGTRNIRIQTPYGRLTVPREKVARVVREDGREEVWSRSGLVPVSQAPSPSPPAQARLTVVITGKSFWHAWDKKAVEEQNFGLRFQVRLDEEPVATYLDAVAHEGEIRGAVVNTFSFAPAELKLVQGAGASVLPPETQPGRIVLKIAMPAASANKHRLRLAYQVNDGTASEPQWRDAAATVIVVEVRADAPLSVLVRQDAGSMEFSGLMKRRMKNVETFHLQASSEAAASGGSS